MTHVVLLLFIAAENTDLFDVGVEKTTKYGIAEGSCSACDQQDFVFED